MKKRLVSLLLAVGMAFSLLPGTVLAADSTAHIATGAPGRVLAALKESPYVFAGGSGTREDPYLISTPDQLNAIRQGLDKHYKLANDIDLSAWGDWMPIGGEELERHGDPTPFTGSLDGAGHVIRGMTITGKRADYQRVDQAQGFEAHCFGLFASLMPQEKAVNPGDAYDDAALGGVSNLGVVDFNINIDASDVINGWNPPIIGAIAATAKNARIAGCWSKGGTAQTGSGTVGGIVGEATNSAIRECWNGSALTGSEVGGIAAQSWDVWFSHCFNTGAANGDQVCGISFDRSYRVKETEKRNQPLIQYCYNAGALSGSHTAGIGVADVIDNIYNAGALSGEEISPIYSGAGMGTNGVKVSHSGERFLKDENWVDSPTLNRKVLAALREDQLIGKATAVQTGVGSFTDVLPTDYFADAVLWAVGLKITNGTTNTTFSPANTCTKAEALTFLYRAEGEPTYDPPSDKSVRETFDATNDGWFFAYYYEASCWAYNKGMIVPTTYLHDPCTRADFVTYLWKAAGSPKVKATSQFADVPGNAAYAQAVAWAVAQGITTGTSDSAFSPNMTCTRGQIVTFLYRAYRNK